MAKSLDRFQPTLFEFPIQNNRTGWHPVWTPTLLVVPWSFDANQKRIQNSKISSVTFAIEKLIEVLVAGHPQNYNPLGPKPDASPNLILFEVTLTYDQLIQHIIDPTINTFYDQQTGGNIVENPSEGDWMEFTNTRGIQGRVEYFPDAEYFDLSSIEINVDNLPTDHYTAAWTVNFFERIESDDVLFCVSLENELKSKLDYPINHPGEIHEEMVNRTPGLYLEDIDKKQDFTVNLYRPFADVLQDHFDEGELFYGINWVKKIPPQLFPYLSYLIGIELPTQSGGQDLDKIRRRMLERGTELQKLKGSELAVKELFSILGFVVEITNLWATLDGKGFFAPNEPDLTVNPIIGALKNEIFSVPVSQTDPMVANYGESGFGNFEVPLLYHNKDNDIVLNAFIVEADSDADKDLQEIINELLDDSNYLTQDTIINASDGYPMLPPELLAISTSGIEASSRLVVSDIEVLSQQHTGLPVIRFDGIKYSTLKDQLEIIFADYKDLKNSVVYIFSTYIRDKITIPEYLKDNQSNRFDVKILSKAGEIEPSLYDYLVDMLFKFKAFHSLLRKISYDADLEDFYNVTDFCTNSFLSQQSDSNDLMIPPACPTDECFITDECNEQNARGGLREKDAAVKNIILEGLREEYDRWRDVTKEWLDIAAQKPAEIEWAQSVSNINIPIPTDASDSYGQDRISYDFVIEVDGTNPIELTAGDKFNMIYMGTYLESISSSGTEPIIFNIQPTKYQVLSDILEVGVEVVVVRLINANIYYVSMAIDIDHEQDVRSKITELNRLSTPDYCYKGRAKDTLDFNQLIKLNTNVRNRPCNLMMGVGVYYKLDHGTIDNVRGWYNDHLQKSDQSLHYSNALFLDDLYKGSPFRPGIEIEKQGFGFSGHRQLRSGLLEDFTHPSWDARPWDISDSCFDFENSLNAVLVTNVEGNQELEFDDVDLSYMADNIKPDIPTYSGESVEEFTHLIYSTTEERSWVELDNTVYTSETEISADYPVFETAKECSSTGTTGEYLDYIDGYNASSGILSFEPEDIWAERKIGTDTIVESDLGSTDISAAATYSSELLIEEPTQIGTIQIDNDYDIWKGYRYDCDCQDYLCGDEERNCNYDFFKNTYGEYDFNNDHLEIDYVASLLEEINNGKYQYDSEIDNWLNWEFEATGPNELEYKDEYGIQYRIAFEENEEVVDITTETFQPRVWGEDPDGYLENGKVFRKGILTNIRQVFVLTNGQWTLNAEGTEQEVTYRQTNYDCAHPTPEDRFIHFQEYLMLDSVEMRVICGPHWTDPVESGDISSEWSAYGSTNGGTDICSLPFGFIDVWGD